MTKQTITKSQLISTLTEKTGLKKKDVTAVFEAYVEAVTEGLKEGKEINVIGFGKFFLSERAARTGRNPQTGAPITIPARISPRFKVGKSLQEAVTKLK